MFYVSPARPDQVTRFFALTETEHRIQPKARTQVDHKRKRDNTDFLPLLRLQLLKLLGQLRPRREQRRSVRRGMRDMHNITPSIAILLQYSADIGARFCDVGDGEEAMVVFVLGVDDDVDAVLRGGI